MQYRSFRPCRSIHKGRRAQYFIYSTALSTSSLKSTPSSTLQRPSCTSSSLGSRLHAAVCVGKSVRAAAVGAAHVDGTSVPDFEIVKIPGNGSCMFQAIIQGHHHLETGKLLSEADLFRHGFNLRRSVCYLLDKNREDMAPFIPGDFEAYLAHMSREGVWGGEPELAMAAKCIERPILVYGRTKSSLFGDSLSKTSEYGVPEFPDLPPVCVLFGNYHYNTLLVKK